MRLITVLFGVITITVPLVAPTGTLVVSSDLETTLNSAVVPLKFGLNRNAGVRGRWKAQNRIRMNTGVSLTRHHWRASPYR